MKKSFFLTIACLSFATTSFAEEQNPWDVSFPVNSPGTSPISAELSSSIMAATGVGIVAAGRAGNANADLRIERFERLASVDLADARELLAALEPDMANHLVLLKQAEDRAAALRAEVANYTNKLDFAAKTAEKKAEYSAILRDLKAELQIAEFVANDAREIAIPAQAALAEELKFVRENRAAVEKLRGHKFTLANASEGAWRKWIAGGVSAVGAFITAESLAEIYIASQNRHPAEGTFTLFRLPTAAFDSMNFEKKKKAALAAERNSSDSESKPLESASGQ